MSKKLWSIQDHNGHCGTVEAASGKEAIAIVAARMQGKRSLTAIPVKEVATPTRELVVDHSREKASR